MNGLDKEQKKDLKEFIKSLRDRDFTIGDSFWISDIQFTVTKFSKDYFGDEE